MTGVQTRVLFRSPVFLPGKFHGQRSLAGYSPQRHKESNMIEQLTDVLTYKTEVESQRGKTNLIIKKEKGEV